MLLKEFLVLKRVMILGKRHRSGIKPTVDHLRYACHLRTALPATDVHAIDIGLVKLDIIRAIIGQPLKLLDRSAAMTMSARTFPYRKRCAPVTLTRDAPVDDILEKIPHSSVPDTLRIPGYGSVRPDQRILHFRHRDEP